ncbi:LysR family transcriptional regulator [Rhodopseudomonas sp. P2A-2r]|uniref:LysR family transcriptional regulator n=1 Tax=Rhodopseudomonas sp. P2A-2r TaxID=2991972 RepID=UPI002234B260|nr:LysR family transcriptional regulator [Rhodopseudomonas sp. P2A-2r]UZE50589.1 LysR family transcriptional regulator [Rhodopseudomonas sp. P2A-2r]
MALTSARMRAVNAVFETGNFSSAARRLGVSQPSIAQLVRDLEADFGVKLFDRHGHHLMATPLCRQLYATTSRLAAMEADAIGILEQREELAGGELRVGLGNSMPGMALISAFKALYPKIQVRIEIGNWSEIMAAVIDQRVDVAVLPEVPQDRRFRCEVCLSQRVVAICHPEHPLNVQGQMSITGLMQYPLVFRTRNSSTQRIVDKAFRASGLRPEPAIVVNSREGMLEAVANRLGVGFLWEHGSSRTDRIAKVVVSEMDIALPEYIFALFGTKGALVELFFNARHAMPGA